MRSAIYEGFRRTNGFAIGICGLILSVVLWKYTPDYKVSLFWLVPAFVLTFIIIIGLVDACRLLSTRRSIPMPKVKAFREPFPAVADSSGILLIEPSELYSYSSAVSVFLDEGGFEVPIGVGYVLNIQQNLLVQVLITEVSENVEGTTWADVKSNNSEALKRLLVRPSQAITSINQNNA